MCVFVHMLEHESRSAAVCLEDSTSPPLPVSSSCSLLSGGTRGAGLNYGEEFDWDTDAGRCGGVLRPGRTGHASLPVATFWDNESYCRPSAADALPTVPCTGTNNSVCVGVWKLLLLALSSATLLSLCCFSRWAPCWHIYLSGKWGTAAVGHVKTFTNSIKNGGVCEKSWGIKTLKSQLTKCIFFTPNQNILGLLTWSK